MNNVSGVTGGDAEVLFGFLGFSHAGLVSVHILSDILCSYPEILSRKALEGVFSMNLVPLMPVLAQWLCKGSQAQPEGMSLCGSVQKTRGT